MFGIGISELILILIIALIFIDPEKLPEIAKAVGKTYADIRRAGNEITRAGTEIQRTVGEAGPSNPRSASTDPAGKGAGQPEKERSPETGTEKKGPDEPAGADRGKKAT
ncbi:MAG: twin-arginine translocase TatA/TatE family subunit [Deltaproteobacteria bacterium]|nr:twin-arginine translocase TatA/TatE family subunit [Deltaproteobacteria bacterium]